VEYGEVFWGVLSTFAAFLLGLAWQRLATVLTHLRARRFWRPLVSPDTVVVVGSFRDLPGFEASGVIGMGDNIALNDLERYFARIGFKRFTVYYSDHVEWDRLMGHSPLHGNLILLGGPDANVITRLVLERVALGIEFVEIHRRHLANADDSSDRNALSALGRRLLRGRSRPNPPWRVPVIVDKESGQMHAPVLNHTELRADCGVVVRCPNPFNPRREVIIFCGSYGYGTLAAVRYAQSTEFLTSLPKPVKALECVLSVDVVAGTPLGIRRQILRPLDRPLPATGASAVVPRIVD
jgi:hypothetical protein